MPAKPLQAALGSLIIQKQYDYSDRELVEQIRENPYYQYFIGLPGYQDKQPFDHIVSLNKEKKGSDFTFCCREEYETYAKQKIVYLYELNLNSASAEL